MQRFKTDEMSVSLMSARSENPESAGHERMTVSDALLPVYLREMGRFDLLNQERESELAREVWETREEMARLAPFLPVEGEALEGNSRRSSSTARIPWHFQQVEQFYDRLLLFENPGNDPELSGRIRDAMALKRRFDRAREDLVVANLRLVVHLSKQQGGRTVPLMDLIQEGNLGLMKAVERFDYRRGYRFSTYAYWWIKQSVDRAIADKSRIVRLPVHLRELQRKIARTVKDLHTELDRRPVPAEIAERLGVPETKIKQAFEVAKDAHSIDALSESDEGRDMVQNVPSPEGGTPHDSLYERDRYARVEEGLRSLEPREQRILRLRFGIGPEKTHTLEQIGKKVNLSRERVRQVEGIALRKLHDTPWLSELEGEFLAS